MCRRHPLPLTRLSGQWSIQLRMGEVYGCRGEPEDSSCRARKVRIKLYQMSGGDLKIKKKFDAGHNAGLIVPPLHLALKFVLCDQISVAQHFQPRAFTSGSNLYLWHPAKIQMLSDYSPSPQLHNGMFWCSRSMNLQLCLDTFVWSNEEQTLYLSVTPFSVVIVDDFFFFFF